MHKRKTVTSKSVVNS